MALIADYLGRNVGRLRVAAAGELIPSIARLGFELELEKHEGNFNDVDGWMMTDDGSLRGRRMEYIFDGPAWGAETERRIANMVAELERNPVQTTFRCSTHLHMDMQTADWNIYEKTVLGYMVFEDAFFDQVDDERRHSNFCIPFMNNDWFSSYFGRLVIGARDEHHKYHHISRWSKYSALNLNVTAVHGTIEFRGSHALTTKDELTGLALRMLSLRKIAEEYKDMTHLEFVEKVNDGGIAEFLPGSFPQDYVPDAGGIAQGFASAMLAVTAGELEGNDVVRRALEEQRLREQMEEARRLEERRQRQRAIRDAVNLRITPNVDAYIAANIAQPHNNTIRGVIDTVRALRGMGVNTTVTALVNPSRSAAAAIELLSRNLEDAQEYARGVTADMLQ